MLFGSDKSLNVNLKSFYLSQMWIIKGVEQLCSMSKIEKGWNHKLS